MMDQQNESSSQDKVSSFKQILRKTNFERKIMKHLFEKFDHLYSQRQLCDVTVAIGDETFECHRFMLAAASDFFEASLTSSFCESSSRVVRISHSDVTAESFRMLLDLLYKGKDVVTKETSSDLLKMAVFLQIRFLQDDVEEYLIDNLNPDICLGIWQLADRYDLRKLAQKAIDMAVAEFEKVSKSEEFLHLPKSLLLIILSSETDMSMDDLFRAVMRWVDEDESRKNHLPELLPFIDFLHLTPGFLGKEALAYRKHPLNDVLFDYIDEALTYNLSGKMEHDSATQRDLLTCQHKLTECPGVQQQVVLFGGSLESGLGFTPTSKVACVSLVDEDYTLRGLQDVPSRLGPSFATCVWRNEVYASGGSKSFMVYRPGRGKWEPLPNMPQSREKHRMVAFNWDVYVIGGLVQGTCVGKEPSADVMVYNIKTERWVIRGRLLLPVEDCAAAVLGHRIYVFGGCGQVVQCMDTLTDQVYMAGRLPSLSYGHRAICDGGTVYVVTQGEVLKMKENYAFADERELLTKTQDGGPLQDDTSESAQTSGDASADPSPTVRFETVGTFPFRRCDYGVYLNGGELVVCGGWKDVDILHDQMALDLKTGKMTHKQQTLMYGRAEFHAHLLYVPDEFLSDSESISQGIIRFSFLPSVLTDVKCLTSKLTTIGSSKWYVLVKSKPGYVGIFLWWIREGSKKKILACCTMKLVPSVEKVDAISRNIEHTFTEKENDWGYQNFAEMDDLTGENSPYLHDGKIMVELNINSLK